MYTVSPGLTLGKWYHIVTEYDGSNFRMYLDGVQKIQKAACTNPPCGDIIYPADYHPASKCFQGDVPLTIGKP